MHLMTVSVPPEHPTIYDEKRRDRSKTKIPWNEGSDVVLSCEVPGGNFVRYYSSKQLYKSTFLGTYFNHKHCLS